MSIEWDARLAIGVAAIDVQHEELFRRAGALVAAMERHSGHAEVARLLPYLEGYIAEHFSAEERLMTTHRYPASAEHVAEHRKFVRDFAALKAEVEARGPVSAMAAKMAAFVGGWLKAHIGRTDLALGIFLTCDESGKRAPRAI